MCRLGPTISKLEDVVETHAGSFAACPGLTRHSAVGTAYNDKIVGRRNVRQTVVIVLNEFQGAFESFHHFKKRLLSKSKSKSEFGK
jgi:hypothetical protein